MTKPLSPDDSILGPAFASSRGSKEKFLQFAKEQKAERWEDVVLYADEIERLAPLVGIDWAVPYAQWAVETGNGHTRWWTERLNPGGIGITGDAAQNEASAFWKDGTDAAQAQIAHLVAYLGRGIPYFQAATGVAPREIDPRYDAVVKAGWFGTVRTIRDLVGRWATDAREPDDPLDYAEKIAKRGNELFGFVAAQEQSMTYPTYPVLMDAKTGRGIQVESPVPIVRKLIPLSKSWVRPGIPLHSPWGWIQHETANTSPGADAEMHYRFLMGLPEGTNVSFHFVVDDHQIIQLIPCNEVTWQAADGSGPGNYASVSCELCVNSDGNEALARRNAEWLCGGVLKANDGTTADIKRHWDFNQADPNRHHCPDHMMNEGYWPTFVANAGKVIAGGATVPTTPTGPAFPPGMDDSLAAEWFGEVETGGAKYHWDPTGPVSLAWLAEGKRTGQWPNLMRDRVIQDTPKQRRRYFVFANALVLFDSTGQPVRVLRS